MCLFGWLVARLLVCVVVCVCFIAVVSFGVVGSCVCAFGSLYARLSDCLFVRLFVRSFGCLFVGLLECLIGLLCFVDVIQCLRVCQYVFNGVQGLVGFR